MLVIEKNIKMPDKFNHVGTVSKEIIETFSKMEVGDSVLLTLKEYRIYLTVKRLIPSIRDKIFVGRVTEKNGDTYRVFRTL